jgi:esterase/lipase superfamily enzyme
MATTVYFASNRTLTGPSDLVTSYGSDIQPPSDSTGVVYGTAFVDGTDTSTNTHGRISLIENISIGRFSDEAVGDLSNTGRNLLVFIHGFNNSFSDAITYGAFNRDWIAASNISPADTSVVAFSWPSLGEAISIPILPAPYLHDQHMAAASGIHLMGFLQNLEPILTSAHANGHKTFLLAHSMGNLALVNTLQNWFLHRNDSTYLFDLAVLAAADCGFDAFDQPDLAGLSGLTRLAKQVSIYFSAADNILQLSQTVNLGAQRLGQQGPRDRSNPLQFPTSQFRMVDATDFRDYDFTFMTSHLYYRMSPEARADIAADMASAA